MATAERTRARPTSKTGRGATAPTCVTGNTRLVDKDICLGRCTSGTCAAPTHDDGKKRNLDETDIDCGGATRPRRAVRRQGVQRHQQVQHRYTCNAGTCAQPLTNDNIKNGAETDVDLVVAARLTEGALTVTPPRRVRTKTCACGQRTARAASAPT